uniref:Lipase maturation factor n=1 Tax=Zonotrichia albicollis TaxID=44394 RepID=A0A8D2MDH6_ZONAL
MLGGLIKIRGDRCWRELTCMDYHYETQPVPNPISYFMHRSPWWFHRFETLVNHFIELLVPFLLLLGRRMVILHGLLQILFQVSCSSFLSLRFCLLHFSGSTSVSLPEMLPAPLTCQNPGAVETSGSLSQQKFQNFLWKTKSDCIDCLDGVGNGRSGDWERQGSITKERTEVILQGTSSLDPNDPTAVWEEFEFKCKPGDLRRRPCLISPYHYRLDWLMWFAAFQTYEQNEWIIHLAGKLLAQEEETLSLLATNPFAGRDPPRWIRGEHFRYKFSQPGGKHARDGKWWIRKRIGPYFPPVNLQGLRKFFEDRNWPYPVQD